MILDLTLGILLFLTLLFGVICMGKLLGVKRQLQDMTDALSDIEAGNGNRRILATGNELTADLSYKMNEIVCRYEERLSGLRAADETNRKLMTSLSHDVRTPLTTLIGYLDALRVLLQLSDTKLHRPPRLFPKNITAGPKEPAVGV